MTGYGESHLTINQNKFRVRIRSFNSKFLEPCYTLPEGLEGLVNILDKHVKSRLNRGKIEVYLDADQNTFQQPYFNKNILEQYQTAFAQFYKKDNIKIPMELLVQLPGFISTKYQGLQDISSKIEFYFLRALLKLIQERRREGRQIKRLIKILLRTLKKTLYKIVVLHKKEHKEHVKMIRGKFSQLVVRNPNLARSIEVKDKLWYACKDELINTLVNDIAEEIARLDIHIKNMEQCIEVDDIVGKKLEFYSQELIREVNTLTAKTDNIIINELGIAMKVSIERIREQIRNIE